MSRRGRFLLVFVLALAMLGLVQCGSSPAPTQLPAAPASTMEATTAATTAPPVASLGTIRAGSEATFPPFEFKDSSGQIVGFDIDLLRAVGEKAGFEVEFIDTPFDGIFVALQSGDFDVVASAATITDEREAIIDFSAPYFEAGLAVVVREDSEYQAPEELEGQLIGVQLGTTGDKLAGEIYGDENVRRYDDVLLAFQALLAGDVEAMVNDLPVTQGYMARNPTAALRRLEGLLQSEQYGFAVNPNRQDVLAAINEGLAAVRADGTYDRIYAEWITGNR